MNREEFEQLPAEVRYLIFHGLVSPRNPADVQAAIKSQEALRACRTQK